MPRVFGAHDGGGGWGEKMKLTGDLSKRKLQSFLHSFLSLPLIRTCMTTCSKRLFKSKLIVTFDWNEIKIPNALFLLLWRELDYDDVFKGQFSQFILFLCWVENAITQLLASPLSGTQGHMPTCHALGTPLNPTVSEYNYWCNLSEIVWCFHGIRILFVSSVAYFWNTYLAYKTSQ